MEKFQGYTHRRSNLSKNFEISLLLVENVIGMSLMGTSIGFGLLELVMGDYPASAMTLLTLFAGKYAYSSAVKRLRILDKKFDD